MSIDLFNAVKKLIKEDRDDIDIASMRITNLINEKFKFDSSNSENNFFYNYLFHYTSKEIITLFDRLCLSFMRGIDCNINFYENINHLLIQLEDVGLEVSDSFLESKKYLLIKNFSKLLWEQTQDVELVVGWIVLKLFKENLFSDHKIFDNDISYQKIIDYLPDK